MTSLVENTLSQSLLSDSNLSEITDLNVPAQALWKWYEHLEDRVIPPMFQCKAGCITTLITFTLLWASHIAIMLFPLKHWCDRNIFLFMYTLYTTAQYFVSFSYILESPAWHHLDKWVKNIPLITGISITGIWAIMAVSELIKLLVHGKVFRSAAEIVAAYVVVLGIPHAAFTIYNLISDIMWYYRRNHGWYTAPTEEDNNDNQAYKVSCEEDDWSCWVENGMDCTGPLCGYDGFIHPEYAGTEMEGPADRRTHKQNGQSFMCWKDGVGEVFCEDPTGQHTKDGYGDVITQPGRSFGNDANSSANTWAEDLGDKQKDPFYSWRDGVGWVTAKELADEEAARKEADHVHDPTYVWEDGVGWEKIDPEIENASVHGQRETVVFNPDGSAVDPRLVNRDGSPKYEMVDQRQYNPENPNYPYPPPPEDSDIPIQETQMKLRLSMEDELDVTEDTLPYTF